jgi:hypothetical protein
MRRLPDITAAARTLGLVPKYCQEKLVLAIFIDCYCPATFALVDEIAGPSLVALLENVEVN